MGRMTIGEVARRAGLRPSAVRYYERIGLLPSPPRIGGQRRYESGVLQRLAVIRGAKHDPLARRKQSACRFNQKRRRQRWTVGIHQARSAKVGAQQGLCGVQ